MNPIGHMKLFSGRYRFWITDKEYIIWNEDRNGQLVTRGNIMDFNRGKLVV